MERKRIVLATTNANKIGELSAMLEKAGLDMEVLGLPENYAAPSEDGRTFAENARIKALAAAAKTGLVCLADDSGLCVRALDGAPGVYSARYAGSGHDDGANIEKLLSVLGTLELERRDAYFACALCLASKEGVIFQCEGRCQGRIAFEKKGANGFGYDPVFLLEDGRTMAELTPDEKNLISHRGKAYKEVLPWLKTLK